MAVTVAGTSTHRVMALIHHTETLHELLLERNDLWFEVGDCVAVYDLQGESRPYSIASGLNESVIRLLFRQLPEGRLTSHMANLKAGDSLILSAPFGWFRPGGEQGNAVFVATGTGIAPFFAYCRSYPSARPQLYYGVRERTEILGLDVLQKLGTNLHLCLSGEPPASPHEHQGRVTDHLQDAHLDLSAHYYLCGLDLMISEVSSLLEERGVPVDQIHQEVFFYA